jgi:putative transcriptional regulator
MTEVETPPLRVRELRRALGWNQTELGYRAGTSPSTISHLENGNHIPNLRLLARVAAALGVEVRDLFPESPESGTTPGERERVGFDAGEVLARKGSGEAAGNLAATLARAAHDAAAATGGKSREEQIAHALEEFLAVAQAAWAEVEASDELAAKRAEFEAAAERLHAGLTELETA